MSINDQINEAWIDREAYHAVTTAPMHGDIAAIAKVEFAAGYRAMAKRLYREVRPENMKPGETYVMLLDGEWIERQAVTVEYLRKLAQLSEKVYRLNLPHPSEIFGEEGA